MGKLMNNRIFYGVTAVLFCAIFVGNNAFAAFTEDDKFYEGNNIFLYDQNYTDACATGDATIEDTSTDTGSDIQKQIFQLLLNGGMNAVQAAAVMGNMKQESNFNPDVHEVGNDIGYGLVQWSFGRRTALEAYASSQGKPASSVDVQIDFLLKEYNDTYKGRLVGTAFEGTVVKDATRAWMVTFEVPAMRPPQDPAALNSVRIPAANQIYKLYANLAPTAVDSAAVQSDCTADEDNGTDGSSAVQGDIVSTAIAYAQPYQITGTKINKLDARKTYQSAKVKWNPSVSWSDCGGFIATVMRSSGVDPDYVKVSVAAQTAYVKAHPDKYKVISNPRVTDLQPGDILLSNQLGHTSMYIGKHVVDGVNYTTAQASLGQQVPNLRAYGSAENYMLGHGAIIARFIGGAN